MQKRKRTASVESAAAISTGEIEHTLSHQSHHRPRPRSRPRVEESPCENDSRNREVQTITSTPDEAEPNAADIESSSVNVQTPQDSLPAPQIVTDHVGSRRAHQAGMFIGDWHVQLSLTSFCMAIYLARLLTSTQVPEHVDRHRSWLAEASSQPQWQSMIEQWVVFETRSVGTVDSKVRYRVSVFAAKSNRIINLTANGKDPSSSSDEPMVGHPIDNICLPNR